MAKSDHTKFLIKTEETTPEAAAAPSETGKPEFRTMHPQEKRVRRCQVALPPTLYDKAMDRCKNIINDYNRRGSFTEYVTRLIVADLEAAGYDVSNYTTKRGVNDE